MSGFDGTGPQGQGPMTGRGEGYCAVRLPDSGETPHGYAGAQGTPIVRPVTGARFTRWLRPLLRPGRGLGRGRGAGKGRGRRFGRW